MSLAEKYNAEIAASCTFVDIGLADGAIPHFV